MRPYFHVEKKKKKNEKKRRDEEDDEEGKRGEAYITADAGAAIRPLYLILLLVGEAVDGIGGRNEMRRNRRLI